jgi:phage terminase small subunit
MNDTSYPAPAHLSECSQALWCEIVGRRARSPGRLALLQVALEALDRADEAAALVAKEGLVTTTETTKAKHAHPGCRIEKDARAQFLRAWGQLNLSWDYEIDGR